MEISSLYSAPSFSASCIMSSAGMFVHRNLFGTVWAAPVALFVLMTLPASSGIVFFRFGKRFSRIQPGLHFPVRKSDSQSARCDGLNASWQAGEQYLAGQSE